MLCSGFSTRLMISRSTVSGDAPGYGKLIDHHRLFDVGNLVDAQVLQRQQPQAHEHDDDRDRRDRLLDAEIRKEHGNLPGGLTSRRPRRASRIGAAAAPPVRPSAWRSETAAPCRPRRDRRAARTRRCARRDHRASARLSASFSPFTRHANALSPSRTMDALGRLRCRGCCESRRALRRRGPRRSAAVFASSKATSTSTWRVVIFAAGLTRVTTPVNSSVGEAVDPEPHVLPGLHLADAVGRHQAFEAQAGRIDDLDAVPCRSGAVSPADTLRSLTMPSKGARTSVRSSCWRAVTTRVRAAARSLCAELRRHLHVFDLLRGDHAGLASV